MSRSPGGQGIYSGERNNKGTKIQNLVTVDLVLQSDQDYECQYRVSLQQTVGAHEQTKNIATRTKQLRQ